MHLGAGQCPDRGARRVDVDGQWAACTDPRRDLGHRSLALAILDVRAENGNVGVHRCGTEQNVIRFPDSGYLGGDPMCEELNLYPLILLVSDGEGLAALHDRRRIVVSADIEIH